MTSRRPPFGTMMGFTTLLLYCLLTPGPVAAQGSDIFDLVILNGRVMDPETGFDQIANVGISGDRIAIITTEAIRGRRTIDATGHMVAPGFIDILSSIAPRRKAHEDKAGDGVTTAIGLHGGPMDIPGYIARHEAIGPVVNYAATVGHEVIRDAVGITDRYAAATPEQIPQMMDLARQAIRDGAVGIGFGLNYTPGASYEEVFAMFQVAGEFGVMAAPPCPLQGRRLSPDHEPGHHGGPLHGRRHRRFAPVGPPDLQYCGIGAPEH